MNSLSMTDKHGLVVTSRSANADTNEATKAMEIITQPTAALRDAAELLLLA